MTGPKPKVRPPHSSSTRWPFDCRPITSSVWTYAAIATEPRKAINWAYSTQPTTAGSRLEWLKTAPGRHSPGTMSETLEKIRELKTIGVHDWALDAIA